MTSNRSFIAVVDSFKLTLPRYDIKNDVFGNKSYSVTRTCLVDTCLFVLYYAYKMGTDEFRNLVENDALNAFIALGETFVYVERHGLIVARLYWLVQRQLLTVTTTDGQYDLENTLSNSLRLCQAYARIRS